MTSDYYLDKTLSSSAGYTSQEQIKKMLSKLVFGQMGKILLL